MTTTLRKVVECQQEDGSWDEHWNTADQGHTSEHRPTIVSKILVTGHLLEVLNSLDSERHPSSIVYQRAAECLRQSLNSQEILRDAHGHLICPFTHAARTARTILATVRTNRLSPAADTFRFAE